MIWFSLYLKGCSFILLPTSYYILELVPFVISKSRVSVLPLIWFLFSFSYVIQYSLRSHFSPFVLAVTWFDPFGWDRLSLLRSFYVCGKVVHLED